ncbi:adenine specific DNA methyltransferase (plasmid) [Borreliella burgdorferi]|nr:adenine specific DNA methyltransferase [Borreliella burgdorferi]
MQSKLNNKNNNKLIFFISYSLVLVSTRPFDNRFTYYSKNRGVS